MENKIPLSVVGLGHVGLPTALGLAELGWQVTGVDSDRDKVTRISGGQVPFYEPGLQELLSKHLESGRFRPTEDINEAIRSASVVFLCVGTPQREDGEPDLTQVEAIARTIAQHLNGYKLVVEKSTVPIITARWIKKTIQRYARATAPVAAGAGVSNANGEAEAPALDVASNPEFLQEGKALKGFLEPDRIICGVETEKAREILTAIYQPLKRPMVITDLTTAELIKHAANAFLTTKISFINTIADLCEAVGADVTQVARGIGLDPRIGPDFLQAGIGYGGYCLPKDLRAFIRLAEEHRVDFDLLKAVEKVNEQRIDYFIKKIRQVVWVLRGKTVGVLGLAFKPGTDDIREALSQKIIDRLLKEGASLQLHDPRAMANMQRVFPREAGRVSYCASPYEAARKADVLLLVTEWPEYRELDLARLRDAMEVPVLVDGRNLFDPHELRAIGFEYHSVGR